MKYVRKIVLVLLLFQEIDIHAQEAERFDVLITEIMADPSPAVGLPNAEYIEIKNVSGKTLSLTGWKLSDASSTTTINANIVLLPDSMLILCANSQVIHFSLFGKAIGVASFPSLDNDGDMISLKSAQGKNIHAVAYSTSWYQNTIKKEGGWSLEMIDTGNPCSGALNWKASVQASGGTPGQINSVKNISSDDVPPRLERAITLDSVKLLAIFDEPLDSSGSADPLKFSLTDGIQVLSSIPQAPLFNTILLVLSKPMVRGRTYQLSVQGIMDCSQNIAGAFNKVKAGRPEEVELNDLVVNEILFNPKDNGVDFVELYNNSERILDASQVFIANRNASGQVANAVKCSEQSFYIFPGEYVVVTADPSMLQSQYLLAVPVVVLTRSSMPSFPDDRGTVVITGSQGQVIDEVPYSEKWHFALISNPEGISLEKVQPVAPSNLAESWHSAASTAGYATPGYKNSQQIIDQGGNAMMEVLPKIFSPDNDGMDDLATIVYQVNEPGYVANITVFDVRGRAVRSLVRSGLMGLKGNWNWDGLDEKKQKLPSGNYIIHAEIFNLQGKKKGFKMVVVLVRKM